MIVPIRAVDELLRVLAGAPDAAPVHLTPTDDGRRVRASVGDVTLTAPLGEGPYPDVARVFPQPWRTRATVATAHLRAAASATSLDGRIHPLLLDASFGPPAQLRLFSPGGWSSTSPGNTDTEADLPAVVEAHVFA